MMTLFSSETGLSIGQVEARRVQVGASIKYGGKWYRVNSQFGTQVEVTLKPLRVARPAESPFPTEIIEKRPYRHTMR